MTPILEVKNLNKTYNNFSLKDVTFSLNKDCITGFIGTNGSGKTTTIKAILGLILKDSGKIKFSGMDMDDNERKSKNKIGIVLDEGYFYEELTLKEMKNVIAPCYTEWDEAVFSAYIKQFDLKLDQKIATLSKGMRMKYAVALALSHHADLLIMDEPTSGLDPLVRSELMDILLNFMKEPGKSVFFSTHITSDLDKIADMIILIDDGRIIVNEEKDELLDTHALVKGDNRFINEQTQKLFLTLHQSPYGFEGITRKKKDVRRLMPDVLMERPTVEDIMLTYIGGNNNAN
ncbi:ABC transporter ATP-binding protein [Aneurinibacillus aneurinilyticus]|jgi:ABC-2 type transport system ATP-binding protein|uniref:ABC transporter ATP-binding protein n=2 Tax=Aneurinibacillus aneurinilyticus TaxID=1391 RepID=A0A848D314_ANEAE|nr:ABC transporter ATP-binding protein [Aneurinibacillus aneurinilyticus]ERI06988.1 ABC transporter, ATP-binding protein [Aneurinibacillus aneurinilyticus ATCC 12856]MCI1696319.1 ABC transporter ATP-binding protein [Aneurinibacillus aneurinilyticus]MED0669062.1 ABC transporter ATP-binding protein [Aneurinibacillus aneurinilyticus]MED0708934.1 ABC transporter ATP-binding protein [Aneurinibacillus aneurinilyticus]MED0722893.1 ABC transporter ATP-binding protein [Aneurinibacillus aneurinilyticus]